VSGLLKLAGDWRVASEGVCCCCYLARAVGADRVEERF